MDSENKDKFRLVIIVAVVIFLLMIVVAALRPDKEEPEQASPEIMMEEARKTVEASFTQTAAAVRVTEITTAPEETPEPTLTPTEEIPSFGEGTFRVGIDIQPGLYRTEGSDTCYWERLSGFSGSFDDIIANSNPDGPTLVEILPSDIGFSSQRCGTWILQQ